MSRAVLCLKELDSFFSFLKRQGLYDKATIVVHGDHGTFAYKTLPTLRARDQLDSRDLKEMFSLLFAVKFPGGTFRLNDEVASLNVLMAQTISRISGKSASELGITVMSEDEPFVYLLDGDELIPAYVDFFQGK